MATHTNDAGNKIWVGQIPLGTHKDVFQETWDVLRERRCRCGSEMF